MDDRMVSIICYMNGEMVHGPYGVDYSCGPCNGILLKMGASMNDLENIIRERLSIDPQSKQISIMYRHPIILGNGAWYFKPLPIFDDYSVAFMWQIVSQFPSTNAVELYLTIRPFVATEIRGPQLLLHDDRTPPTDHNEYEANVNLDSDIRDEMGTDDVMPDILTQSQPFDDDHDIDRQEEVPVNEGVVQVNDPSFDPPGSFDDIVDEDAPDIEAATRVGTMPEYEVPTPMYYNINYDAVNETAMEHLARSGPTTNFGGDLHIGLRFSTKEDLQNTVKRYCVEHHHDFTVIDSDKKSWAVRCKQAGDGCDWRLRACKRKSHGLFEITKYHATHTCVYEGLSQDHSQLDVNLICAEVFNLVHREPTTSVAVLHQTVRDKFGYDVHYKRVWKAKRKAFVKIFGDWETSYEMLRKWKVVLVQTNEGTQVDLEEVPRGLGIVEFMRFFWAFGPCIVGFKYCRPLIQTTLCIWSANQFT